MANFNFLPPIPDEDFSDGVYIDKFGQLIETMGGDKFLVQGSGVTQITELGKLEEFARDYVARQAVAFVFHGIKQAV